MDIEPVMFGSVPLKGLANFEDSLTMPTENATFQCESQWVLERTTFSPAELATTLAQGCMSSLGRCRESFEDYCLWSW